MDIVEVVLLLLMLTSLALSFKSLRRRTRLEKINLAKEKAYQLFLYAEKQEWTGAVKMNWVIRIMNMNPASSKVVALVGEDNLGEWLQSLYDDFKQSLRTTTL